MDTLGLSQVSSIYLGPHPTAERSKETSRNCDFSVSFNYTRVSVSKYIEECHNCEIEKRRKIMTALIVMRSTISAATRSIRTSFQYPAIAKSRMVLGLYVLYHYKCLLSVTGTDRSQDLL